MSARTVLQRVIVMIIGCILLVQQPVAMPPLMTSSMPIAPKPTTPGAGPIMPVPGAQLPVQKPIAVPVVPVLPASMPAQTSPVPVAQMPTSSVPVQLPQVPATVPSGPQLAMPVQSSLPVPAVMPPKLPTPVPVPIPQTAPSVVVPTPGLPTPVPVAAMPAKSPVAGPVVPLKSDAVTAQPKEDSLDGLDDDSQDIGLSTIELEEPQGNWLYKRLWWERAENRFEKIRALIDAIWSLRSDFFSKRTELDKTVLDPFYLFIGAGQGEFREIVADIIKRLQKAQQVEGDLDEQERALLVDLQDQKRELDAMQKSIDAILTLDHDVDIALSRLMEQLNRARDYEREAWQSLKDIARELSDKKAQEIFYHMETIWKNLKGVHKYIQGEFANHFNTLIKKVTNEVNTTKQIVQIFKTKGIDLKERADKLEQADKTAHDRALEKKAKEEAEQKGIEEAQKRQQEEEEEPSEQGWIGWILSLPGEAWNTIRLLTGL